MTAGLLVVLRSVVPLMLERSLDSDQAVVGLMAKHLSEFRAFPLFFYGQNYMLGVQAWIAAPFFWLGGPTVAMLRLPLLLINVGVVVAVIVALTRRGLRPALAWVAALPLTVTTPLMSDAMLRPLGAAVEPFAWVLILWGLRRRPLWFGVVFCVAFLHREFAAYALPALLLAQWREGRFWTLKACGTALVGAAGVWLVVDWLKRSINVYGPSGGEFVSGSLALQSKQLLLWLSPHEFGGRVWDFLHRGVPDMFGARTYWLWDGYGLFSQLQAGSLVAGMALAGALVVSVVGLVMGVTSRTEIRKASGRPDALLVYLGAIGVCAVLGYGLHGGIDTGAVPVVRYALFVLWIPVALLGGFFLWERRGTLRLTVAGLVCVWASLTMVDAARVAREFVTQPPDNPHREAADYLVAHGTKYGWAQYWDAYVITFLSREHVVLASTSSVRISLYQQLAEAHADTAVRLVRQPCEGGPIVAAWCVLPVSD